MWCARRNEFSISPENVQQQQQLTEISITTLKTTEYFLKKYYTYSILVHIEQGIYYTGGGEAYISLSSPLPYSPATCITTIGELAPHASGLSTTAATVLVAACHRFQEFRLQTCAIFFEILEAIRAHNSCNTIMRGSCLSVRERNADIISNLVEALEAMFCLLLVLDGFRFRWQ